MGAQIVSLAARRAERAPQHLVNLSSEQQTIVRAFAPWDGQQVRVRSTGQVWEVLGWNPTKRLLVLQRTEGAHLYHQQRRADELELLPPSGPRAA